jgi:hypothetical protein
MNNGFINPMSTKFYIVVNKEFYRLIQLPSFALVIGFSASRRELKGKTGVNPALSP